MVSTDGISSFVTLVYDSEAITAIEELNEIKVAGFDAGDGIRSATILSPGFASIEILETVNVFRIDGMRNSYTNGGSCIEATILEPICN